MEKQAENILTGKKIILYGAGVVGARALEYFGLANVEYFVDKYKAGGFYLGRIIISIEELVRIQDQYDIVICVSSILTRLVESELSAKGVQNLLLFNQLRNKGAFFSNPEIAKFKDIHKNDRCFIIGNGPSLKMEHLDMIHKSGIPSFACNWIFKAFEKTTWRPDYYCASDANFIAFNMDKALLVPAKEKFFAVALGYYHLTHIISTDTHAHILNMVTSDYLETMPPFSSDISRFVGVLLTVTHIMLQCAAYMGFKEMYLLGVDCTALNLLKEVKAGNKVHFYDSTEAYQQQKDLKYSSLHFEPDSKTKQVLTFALYKTAEDYSRAHGFRIYNATIGGELEVFERVNFYDIIK